MGTRDIIESTKPSPYAWAWLCVNLLVSVTYCWYVDLSQPLTTSHKVHIQLLVGVPQYILIDSTLVEVTHLKPTSPRPLKLPRSLGRPLRSPGDCSGRRSGPLARATLEARLLLCKTGDTVIARVSGLPLSGAAPKRIQTYRALNPSIPLGGSTYSHALLLYSMTTRVTAALFCEFVAFFFIPAWQECMYVPPPLKAATH
ncbi:hypothetical protein E2C01_024303 [Portunus trituberculatus]|uniref:Uncharacterized protein n=1 Tax=Portunus trituberculatus TaxID=210409 RepID=A0A5B7EBX3_PORTR|nr:hypothetical protein [Portunus trituberculatus]